MKTIYVKEITGKVTEKFTGGREIRPGNVAATILFLCAMFLLGRAAAQTLQEIRQTAGQGMGVESTGQTTGQGMGVESAGQTTGQGVGVESTGQTTGQGVGVESTGRTMGQGISVESAGQATGPEAVSPQSENWGLGFGKSGEKPTGNATVEQMKQYDAYYMAEGEEKVLYLTFDCGYENGNTTPILDALKKHNAPATFFVVGHFLESAPDIVKRMVEDGHTVGNHTYHHYDMSKISDQVSFQKEMDDVADKFKEITGTELARYYRPPQGKYSTANLQMAKDMGYITFFWSLAYVDWNQDAQPSHEEAFEKLMGRIHPGAIVLLHSTSQTNGEILDELLGKWEALGYTFRPLSDFVEGAGTGNAAAGGGSQSAVGSNGESGQNGKDQGGSQGSGAGRILQDQRGVSGAESGEDGKKG